MPLAIVSSAFDDGGTIPREYTCEGDDTSPPLSWSGVPSDARSLVLIVDDSDAPGRTAVHWILYNIPASVTGLAETEWGSGLPDGVLEGHNDFDRTQYGGPCPPIGRHRYFHKLFALDTTLPEMDEATKAQVEAAMQPHIIAEAALVGTYAKASAG